MTAPRTTPPKRKLPVMVFLHGGSFKDGAGHLYDAKRLATQGDVIVVTVNYRLGVFGFLSHPILDNPQRGALSGNFGIEAQQAALRWVQRNAAAFGGDPGSVTLFGESAGAVSTCAHLAAPGSAGLFHRAISQSAPCTAQWSEQLAMVNNPRPRAQAERDGQAIVAALQLSESPTAEQLRDLQAHQLLDAADEAGQPGFGPVVGGGVLPVDPARALGTGRFHKVPVLHGINRHEQRMHVWGYETVTYEGRPIPAEQYPHEIGRAFEPHAEQVLRHYPLGSYELASHALAAALTDADFARPTLDTARALARWAPTYTFEFADDNAPWFTAFPRPYPMGAYHAAELPYLFDVGYTEPLTAEQRRLADQMIGYWTRFAHSGNPNAAGAPAWHRFTPARPSVQSLAPGTGGIAPADFAANHQYDFWSSLQR